MAEKIKNQLKKKINKKKRNYTFDQENLDKEGFPAQLSKAFIETANMTDTIVLSRTPGGASTNLIAAGHDLKSYEIKSKSCDWGPMTGFLCKLPPLNKSGALKIKYNYGYLEQYLRRWREKSKLDKKGDKTEENYSIIDLFKPLKISDARKEEIFMSSRIYGLGVLDENYTKIRDLKIQYIYGLCRKVLNEGGSSVKMEYLLRKTDDKMWEVYHGKIYYKKEGEEDLVEYKGNESNESFVDKKEWDARPEGEKNIERDITLPNKQKFELPSKAKNSKLQEKVDGLRKSRNDVFSEFKNSKIIDFHEVECTFNPYPPYPEKLPAKNKVGKNNPEYYKNFVTGDYDLFACWPKITYPLQEQIREAEINLNKKMYFSSFGKNLTVGLRPEGTFNHIYIEFIPGVPAIDTLEDIDKGNINDLTELVAGRLNSVAGVALENKGTYANKAFHSDEGGRPKIDDIEFPVAYFLPGSLKFNNYSGGTIKNINEFLNFINACNEKGYRINLSHGWFIFLITHALNNTERKSLENEFNKAKNPTLDLIKAYLEKYPYQDETDCRENVLKYLLGYTVYDTASKELKKYKANPALLNEVAKVFLPFLNMSEADESIIKGKVSSAKSIISSQEKFEPVH